MLQFSFKFVMNLWILTYLYNMTSACNLEGSTEQEVNLLVNDTLKLICLGGNNPMFYENTAPIADEYIKRLKAVELKMDTTKSMSASFVCRDGAQIVRKHKVNIGYKPLKTESFNCVSYNWENMTCLIKQANNPVKTDIVLKMGYEVTKKPSHFCNVTDLGNNEKKFFLGTSTSPYYRRMNNFYHFTLESENQFGQLTEKFAINPFANMKLAPPTNLTVVNVTATSARITWEVEDHLKKFPEFFIFVAVLDSDYQDHPIEKKVTTSPDPSKGVSSIQFKGLILNTEYTVRLKMQTFSTNLLHKNNPEMWSHWKLVKFTTENYVDVEEAAGNLEETFVETFENLKGIVNNEIRSNLESLGDNFLSILKISKK